MEYRTKLRNLIIELVVVIVFLLLVFNFVFGVTVQHGNDMYPAIKDGDLIVYYRTHSFTNTEAVVYRSEDRICTGRIAAGPGTCIGCTSDMQMTFDGLYLPASYSDGIYSRTYAAEGEKLPFTVRENAFFILGDNREDAEDSRIQGQISKRNIKGRIVTVIRRRQI